MLIVSNIFVTYLLNLEIFEFTTHFVPCKISLLMTMKTYNVNLVICILYLFHILITIVLKIKPNTSPCCITIKKTTFCTILLSQQHLKNKYIL